MELAAEIRRAGGIMRRLRDRARGREDLTALVGNKACKYPRLSYAELFRTVEEAAAGLLELGAAPGRHIGLIAENSDLWLIADLALQSLGAVDVPRGGDASAEEVAFCLAHAECQAAIVESAELLPKIAPVRDRLGFVVVLKGDAPKGAISFDEVLRLGKERLRRSPREVAELTSRVGPDQLATVIYTSGTTGNPKGVMLTHSNLLHNVAIVPEILHLASGTRFLSFLPSWHSFERVLDYVILDSGMELHYSSKWTVKEDFRRVRPQFVAGVPRLWETMYGAVVSAIEKSPPLRRKLVGVLLGASARHRRCMTRARRNALDGSGDLAAPGPLARLGLLLAGAASYPLHLLASRLVYRRLHLALGGEIRAMISGGGPLPAHVDEFYVRAGLPFLNGYGLTESSPVISVRIPERNLVGTIGPPIPLTAVRVVDEGGTPLPPLRRGVIQAKGPQIMQGYYRNPEASSRALPGGGWLDTGDLGYLTSNGDLVITGRAKDTIVLRGGENVEPEPIEAMITSSAVIADALVVGHGQKTLGALILPDPAGVRVRMPELAALSDDEIIRDPRTKELMRTEVGNLISKRRGYLSFELVGRIGILERPFTVDEGTLTATMKKRRSAIEAKFREALVALFAEGDG